MLRRSIIALAISAALAMTIQGGAFAAGHPGHSHSAGGGGHVAGPRGFGGGGGGGFVPGYAPGTYYGGGYEYYPPDYGYYVPPDYGYVYPPGNGYYYEPDPGAAAALGIISAISGIIGSHLYHHHCWLHHGRRLCR